MDVNGSVLDMGGGLLAKSTPEKDNPNTKCQEPVPAVLESKIRSASAEKEVSVEAKQREACTSQQKSNEPGASTSKSQRKMVCNTCYRINPDHNRAKCPFRYAASRTEKVKEEIAARHTEYKKQMPDHYKERMRKVSVKKQLKRLNKKRSQINNV